MIKALPRNRKRLAKGIAENIRLDIAEKQFVSGTPLPTARELAAIYRVSQVTANRALELLDSEGLIYRVKGSGSFVADSGEKKIQYTIGLAIPSRGGNEEDIHAAFEIFPETIIDSLSALGHRIKTLSRHDLEYAGEESLKDVDGVVIAPELSHSSMIAKNLLASGKPVVLIRNTHFQHLPFHQVIPDVNTGFRQAIDMFLSLGHKQIIIAYCDKVEENLIRKDEFIRCAKQQGIKEEDLLIFSRPRMVGDLGRISGRQIGEDIITSGSKHPAVFSVGDFISFGIADALHAEGMELGRNMDLISFDDLESDGLCPYKEPVLTCVSFPRERISRKAVEFLLDQVENGDGVLHILRVPTELKIRGSVKQGG